MKERLLRLLSSNQHHRETILEKIRQHKKDIIKLEDNLVELREEELKLRDQIQKENHKEGLV